jgi:hypothetical protein
MREEEDFDTGDDVHESPFSEAGGIPDFILIERPVSHHLKMLKNSLL